MIVVALISVFSGRAEAQTFTILQTFSHEHTLKVRLRPCFARRMQEKTKLVFTYAEADHKKQRYLFTARLQSRCQRDRRSVPLRRLSSLLTRLFSGHYFEANRCDRRAGKRQDELHVFFGCCWEQNGAIGLERKVS
jgi:hypothetical protein